MASPPVPGIDEVAARLRRALVVMLGGIPPGDDGEVPADIRLAHDIGMLGAIIGNWRARLTDPGMVAVAESAYAQTALMLGTEAAPSAGALARAVLQLADAGDMPDTYWSADSRVALARQVLAVPPDGRHTHARLWDET